jgi:hypothetical protein
MKDLTVEELIELLKKEDPKAKIITDSGEGTIDFAINLRPTFAYRWSKKDNLYGMSQYFETDNKDDAEHGHVGPNLGGKEKVVKAVFIS